MSNSDRYILQRELGHGVTGQVFLAEHVDLGREEAVKIIPLTFVKNRQQLLAEAKILASLDGQENVVRVYDAGDWDDQNVYTSSEYWWPGWCQRPRGQVIDKTRPQTVRNSVSHSASPAPT